MGNEEGGEVIPQNLIIPDVSGIAGVKIPDTAQTVVLTASGAGVSPSDLTARYSLGGLGAAWVERSPTGAFSFRCPPSQDPVQAQNQAQNQAQGTLTAFPVSGCQFAIFEQVEGEKSKAYALTSQPPEDQSLSQWQWYPSNGSGTTAAVQHLYPRSWYTYGGVFQSQILCEQFSPILPGNYQETSYPLGVFEWRFYNPCDRPVTLSVMLSWENLIGSAVGNDGDTPALKFNQSGGNFNRWVEDFFRVGCSFMNAQALGEEGYLTTKKAPPVNQGQWAIVTAENPAVEVFHHTQWRPDGDGGDLWESFAGDGSLANENGEAATEPGERLGAAIAVRFTIRPGRSRTIPFILSWDLPTSPVETAAVGPMPYRFADFFGRDGQNAWYMARTALKHCDTWRSGIEKWHQSMAIAETLPDSLDSRALKTLKTAAINSLSQLAIELAPWTAADDQHPRGQLGRGDRPTFDNTWALHKLWPALEQSQIRSTLTQVPAGPNQAPAQAEELAHVGDGILRLCRSHQADPNFVELAALWAVIVHIFDPLPSDLGSLARNDTDLAWLDQCLEAAIALAQELLNHQPEWIFPDFPLPVSLDTLATAINAYTELRLELGVKGGDRAAAMPSSPASSSVTPAIQLWRFGISL